MVWLLSAGTVLGTVGLFLYSYTQIDLALTLSRAGLVQLLQRQFQYVGFFNRPLSTGIYLSLLLWWFILYGLAVVAAARQWIGRRQVWYLIAVMSGGLLLSYPAFSYDIYNYIFTAKTVLYYGKNPYEVIPLDFAGFEPMLSFMRWTHLPSAYTPLWILLTLPFYLLGFGTLLLTVWSFKLIGVLGYLAAAWGITRILDKTLPKKTVMGLTIFAFNPLIIIESLVSAHNDIVMMAIAIWAVVLLQRRRMWSAWWVMSVSVALKLMTVFLLPAFFLPWKRLTLFALMMAAFMAVQFQRDVLPWYFVWVVPFVALLPESLPVFLLSSGFSLGLLLRYAPPLYFGNWDAPVPALNLWLTWIPAGIGTVLALLAYLKSRGVFRR